MKRRRVLEGMAGAALLAPFFSSLEGAAGVDTPLPPRRLVIFHTPNGCLTNRWFPSVEDGAIDAAALSGTTLEALSPFASKLLFPRGLCMYPYGAVSVDGTPYFDPTEQSMGSKLTAAPIDPEGEHWARGRSFDHVLAELVNPDHRAPLVLSVTPALVSAKTILSYRGPRDPVTPVTDPRSVFGDLATSLDAPSSEPAYRAVRRSSVIDAVRDDLASLGRVDLSSSDRQKITAWLDLLREVEQTLPLVCGGDARLGIDDAALEAASPTDSATAFTLGGDMMLKLIALSMMCDANRSIVLHWPAYVTFTWDGLMHDYDHAGLAHRTGSAAVGGPCVDGALGMLKEIDDWYAGRFAELVALADGIPEGDGTLLDSSALMWLPQYADGNVMNVNNLPIVIAGSAGGALRQGISVNLEGTPLGTGNSEASCNAPGDTVGYDTGSTTGNVPLNKLYVTLLGALGATQDGAPISSFGQVDTNDVEAGITDPGGLSALEAS